MDAAVKSEGKSRLLRTHGLLVWYNGLVVLLMAGFMSITQEKIISAMAARSFLATIPIVPLPTAKGFSLAVGSYVLLMLLGSLCRRRNLSNKNLYFVIMAEIVTCLILMHSLNLGYDGVVLVVVADLMFRYQGKNQGWLLLVTMLGLYFMASYNLALFQSHVS